MIPQADEAIAAILQKMAARWAPRSVLDVELLTVREIAGVLRMSTKRAYRFIRALPSGAVIREKNAPNNRILVQAWDLGHYLQLQPCPGCGREWPEK